MMAFLLGARRGGELGWWKLRGSRQIRRLKRKAAPWIWQIRAELSVLERDPRDSQKEGVVASQ